MILICFWYNEDFMKGLCQKCHTSGVELVLTEINRETILE